jgi:hypothetical protein
MKEEALAVQEVHPANLLSIIDRVVGSGELTTEKVSVLERLLAMQMTVREEDRKAAFARDLNQLQAELPQIQKDGRIMVGNTERSRYALIEDIDTAIRPLLARYGFSLSFDEDSSGEKELMVSCKLLHRDGHFEVKKITVPFDSGAGRSAIQSRGSTQSYAQRYLIKMHLNMVERGKDDDGQGGSAKITSDQANDLQTLMEEVGADRNRFLKHLGVASLADVLVKNLPTAIKDLERKRQ